MKSLLLRYLGNDLRRNRGVTIVLLIVLVVSAFLMASGALVMERLGGSVGRLSAAARPPHFLQMHQGEYDRRALDDFAAAHPEIADWQIEQMAGFDGQQITWTRPGTESRGDLSESLIDNLFVKQSAGFDLLLDRADAPAQPAAGEVYAPVGYERLFDLRTGDVLTVGAADTGVRLRVAGFVRDAQMASSLSSATRFVVAPQDFARLQQSTSAPEVIIAYRLHDTAQIDGLQRAYESDSALPKNGQAVTEVMIRLVNMLSDGLVAVAFVFAGLLLIIIALLNVRFVMRGTIEDEIHEIGALKAIGIPQRTITLLYLARYGAMALLACLIGGGLAVASLGALTSGIRANFAEAPVTWLTVLAPILALAALLALVLGISARAMRAVRRVGVVEALVQGRTTPARHARPVRRAKSTKRARTSAPSVPARKSAASRKSHLAPSRGGRLNLRLALLDLRAERRRWGLVPAVFFLAALLITLPMNLLSTFESPRFVTYMGAPQSDLRADIQFVDPAAGTGAEAMAKLRGQLDRDSRVTDVKAFATVLAETPGEEGWEALRVGIGDYSDAGLVYLSGSGPRDGQIALSAFNAEKYGVGPGDSIELRQAGGTTRAQVSGVYQDVTSGGFTAKLQGEPPAEAERWTLFADVAPGADPAGVSADLDAANPAATVIPMREYVRQTLSYVTDTLRTAVIITLVFGIGSAALISTLFLRLCIGRDRQKMGVLSVLGFSTNEIIGQLHLKMLITVAAGTVLGTLVAATLGERLVGALISLAGLGLTQLTFIPQPWIVYALFPVLLIGAGMGGAALVAHSLRGADRSGWLR
ncbi:ABC transporter permease [Brevibacterium sp. 91QC2O2]|uniref:ABC transporter permease n=1 Tax=Brevibacterium sp. 91QC2O2 TaxID=2968458 RepID=UPI00211C66BB|nr:ABC transporter permease [Brevibacterium sp. 91QC2O2]MCQ9367227.1 ABC transporter permease [Brevibacterium sp. 91QC2O2]